MTLARSGPKTKEARMGVKVREKPKNSGNWWIFIDHQGRRKAKKIGRDTPGGNKDAVDRLDDRDSDIIVRNLSATKEKRGNQ